MILTTYFPPLLANCSFDKTPTLPIVVFEVLILLGVAASALILTKIKDKMPLRFLVMAIGVLLFELFTSPMWNNYKMGWWAYIYHDVSWILTVGWTALILSVVILTDKFLNDWSETKKFLVYLVALTAIIIPLEMVVVNIGLRSYSPEVLQIISGIFILGVPIEILYYTPVFTGLVIAFYKYWSFAIDDELLVPLRPLKQRKWLRSLLFTLSAIFLFEIMVEPMVKNQKFPEWSYIFHDITLFTIVPWALMIGITTVVVSLFFIHWPILYRFLIAISFGGILAWPLESWYIINGFRVYSPSVFKHYTGFVTPITNLPIEIPFAIPLYMALIIAFIRYWEITLDNKL